MAGGADPGEPGADDQDVDVFVGHAAPLVSQFNSVSTIST
jgi:hypothetical protein